MTPVNLADLPGDQPAPTGLVQVKRGAVEGYLTWNNSIPAQPLSDGGGNPMQISITPPRPGWWCIHASSMWHQNEAYWMSWEWGVQLNIADADGRILHKLQCSKHSACTWNYNYIDCVFRLNQGVAYTAHMRWLFSSGWNQLYHTEKRFHYIEGEFIGEGAV